MSGSPFHGIFSALGQSGAGAAEPARGNRSVFSFGGKRAPEPHLQEAVAPQETGAGKLAVDIYEQDDYTIIRAPIAGVRLSDIDIEVNDNVLTIRGNRRLPDAIPANQYYLQECFWGPFARSITLPVAIDPRKVRATFSKDCILKILIPKEEKVKIVKISEA